MKFKEIKAIIEQMGGKLKKRQGTLNGAKIYKVTGIETFSPHALYMLEEIEIKLGY